MKKERGFSLMEMMVILLIVSITAAATAPMINKKTQGEASEKSPWSWVNGQSIFYNKNRDINQTVAVGSLNKPNGENASIYIDSPDTVAKMAFGSRQSNIIRLFANDNHILFTNTSGQNTPLLNASNITNAVAIGPNATLANRDFVILGSGSTALSPDAIVIGNNSTAGSPAQNVANLPEKNKTVLVAKNDSGLLKNAMKLFALPNLVKGTSPILIAYKNSIYPTVPTIPNGLEPTTPIDKELELLDPLGPEIVPPNSDDEGSSGGQPAVQQSSYIAIGQAATATGTNSIAVGTQASATAENSLAIGNGATVNGQDSIVIGSSTVTNNGSIVIGNYSTPQDNSGIVAIGRHTSPVRSRYGQDSVAIGSETSAEENGISIGMQANSNYNFNHSWPLNKERAVAIGASSVAFEQSVAIGNAASALSRDSIAIGNLARADTSVEEIISSSIAIGDSAEANHGNNIAIGSGARANIDNSSRNNIAIGANVEIARDCIQLGTNQTVYIPGNLVVGGHIAGLGLFAEKYLIVSGRNKAFFRRDLSGTSNNDDVFRNAELRNGDSDSVDTLTENTVENHAYYQGPTLYRTYVNSYTDENGSSVTSFSDRRLKNVGESFKAGLEEVKKLEVFHYTFKKDPAKTARVGVMAQDLQKIFPDAVFKGEEGFLRIRMEDMFYAVVNAVKEINTRADEQNKKLAELNKQNKELKKRAIKLKKRINKLAKKNIKEDNIS